MDALGVEVHDASRMVHLFTDGGIIARERQGRRGRGGAVHRPRRRRACRHAAILGVTRKERVGGGDESSRRSRERPPPWDTVPPCSCRTDERAVRGNVVAPMRRQDGTVGGGQGLVAADAQGELRLRELHVTELHHPQVRSACRARLDRQLDARAREHEHCVADRPQVRVTVGTRAPRTAGRVPVLLAAAIFILAAVGDADRARPTVGRGHERAAIWRVDPQRPHVVRWRAHKPRWLELARGRVEDRARGCAEAGMPRRQLSDHRVTRAPADLVDKVEAVGRARDVNLSG